MPNLMIIFLSLKYLCKEFMFMAIFVGLPIIFFSKYNDQHVKVINIIIIFLILFIIYSLVAFAVYRFSLIHEYNRMKYSELSTDEKAKKIGGTLTGW